MIDARTYIVPELMEAYLKGDVDTLKLWCSEAVSNKKIIVIALFNKKKTIDIQCFNSSHSSPNAAGFDQRL